MANEEDLSQGKRKSSRLKIVIVVLSVLLALSAGGLAARYVYLRFFALTQVTATVPDNFIGEDHTPDDTPSSTGTAPAADKLELYQGKPGDNEKIEVSNMLPGDTETKYFCVKAYHGADITLFFNTEVTEQTKALGDVLHVKVAHMDSGKVLCDAPFAEINGQEFSELLKKNGQGKTDAYYRIDVSLDAAVGNEYQAAMLKADLNWYVKNEGGLASPPQACDAANLTLWIMLALSFLLLIFFLLLKHRKEDGRHER